MGGSGVPGHLADPAFIAAVCRFVGGYFKKSDVHFRAPHVAVAILEKPQGRVYNHRSYRKLRHFLEIQVYLLL